MHVQTQSDPSGLTDSPALTKEINAEQAFRTGKVDSLSRFKKGDCGTVVELNAEPDLQGRLMGMGLFIGTRFRLLRGGDSTREPLILAIGETRIALDSGIAGRILVER